jgi:hypothetical protein
MPRGVRKKKTPNLLRIAGQLGSDEIAKLGEIQAKLAEREALDTELATLAGTQQKRRGPKPGSKRKAKAQKTEKKADKKAAASKSDPKAEKAAKAQALLAKLERVR